MNDLHTLLLTLSRAHEDFLLAQPRYADPRALAAYRGRIYSQNGEDGMIAEIFQRLGGPRAQTFIEIGVGEGHENNTRFLLENGWRGIWCEADGKHCEAIQSNYAAELTDGRLQLCTGALTRENAPNIALPGRIEWDLLSIDIDMNTSHVWRALKHLRPLVAVIEYNPAFPASIDWEIPYDPAALWQGDNYFGASLKCLEHLGAELGYVLVGCELSGINAFFVREDLASEDKFLAPFTAEEHYEPLRIIPPVAHQRRKRAAQQLRSAA